MIIFDVSMETNHIIRFIVLQPSLQQNELKAIRDVVSLLVNSNIITMTCKYYWLLYWLVISANHFEIVASQPISECGCTVSQCTWTSILIVDRKTNIRIIVSLYACEIVRCLTFLLKFFDEILHHTSLLTYEIF